MKALLLRLEAPMQSWGTRSRFSERDTQIEPSKSGVIGILAAALGRRRHEPLDDLAALEMGVRIDREGRKMADYHTVGGGSLPRSVLAAYGVRSYGVARANGNGTETALSKRHYLADASFVVALSGDETLLQRIATAMRAPVFPIFLGRKSFVPAEPLFIDGDNPRAMEGTIEELLSSLPYEPRRDQMRWERSEGRHVPALEKLRLVLEVSDSDAADHFTSERADEPLSFVRADRRFRGRSVRTAFTSKPIEDWFARHPLQERAA